MHHAPSAAFSLPLAAGITVYFFFYINILSTHTNNHIIEMQESTSDSEAPGHTGVMGSSFADIFKELSRTVAKGQPCECQRKIHIQNGRWQLHFVARKGYFLRQEEIESFGGWNSHEI